MKATIEITPCELMLIIKDYCEKKGFKEISNQDIVFKVEEVEHSNQRDTHELRKVIIKNIRIR